MTTREQVSAMEEGANADIDTHARVVPLLLRVARSLESTGRARRPIHKSSMRAKTRIDNGLPIGDSDQRVEATDAEAAAASASSSRRAVRSASMTSVGADPLFSVNCCWDEICSGTRLTAFSNADKHARHQGRNDEDDHERPHHRAAA
jgi:hypothetical protein